MIFDNHVRETAVRASSAVQHATSWDGAITFNDVQSYENKVVELQIMGYRLRALQHYRYVSTSKETFLTPGTRKLPPLFVILSTEND